MKKLRLAVAFLFTLSLPVFAFAGLTKVASPSSKQMVLFVLLAKQGTIQEAPNKPGQYQLTLKNINPDIIYFADRPARFANHMAVKRFINEWTLGSFKSDPPNAVMESIRLDPRSKLTSRRSESYAIVLTNPTYDFAKRQLVFDIKPLSGNPVPLPVLANSDYLALFIDSACLSCW